MTIQQKKKQSHLVITIKKHNLHLKKNFACLKKNVTNNQKISYYIKIGIHGSFTKLESGKQQQLSNNTNNNVTSNTTTTKPVHAIDDNANKTSAAATTTTTTTAKRLYENTAHKRKKLSTFVLRDVKSRKPKFKNQVIIKRYFFLLLHHLFPLHYFMHL